LSRILERRIQLKPASSVRRKRASHKMLAGDLKKSSYDPMIVSEEGVLKASKRGCILFRSWSGVELKTC
jgi:hypothetical protein